MSCCKNLKQPKIGRLLTRRSSQGLLHVAFGKFLIRDFLRAGNDALNPYVGEFFLAARRRNIGR